MRAQRTNEAALSRLGQHAALGRNAAAAQISLDRSERQLDAVVRVCAHARRTLGRRWLCAVAGPRGAVGTGRTPFRAALAIAAADVAVFAFGADALTSAAHLTGALR